MCRMLLCASVHGEKSEISLDSGKAEYLNPNPSKSWKSAGFKSKQIHVHLRGGHRSGVPESTPAVICVFCSDPVSQSKICEMPDLDPESLFNFGSSRSMC